MAAAYFKGREGAYIDRFGASGMTRTAETVAESGSGTVEVCSCVARCGMKRGVEKRKWHNSPAPESIDVPHQLGTSGVTM